MYGMVWMVVAECGLAQAGAYSRAEMIERVSQSWSQQTTKQTVRNTQADHRNTPSRSDPRGLRAPRALAVHASTFHAAGAGVEQPRRPCRQSPWAPQPSNFLNLAVAM